MKSEREDICMSTKRGFEFARKINEGIICTDEQGNFIKQHENARLPEYQTTNAAGADFYCAEEVTIPSLWAGVAKLLASDKDGTIHNWAMYTEGGFKLGDFVKPTLVHTGVKAMMPDVEYLMLANRSSNPAKTGLVLANGVGIIDSDYYNNPDNDGEIMFAFYNFMPYDVTIKVGDRIGQGIFQPMLQPTFNGMTKDMKRNGGFGSTGRE